MTIADEYERYMLELINAERAAVGAPPLQLEQNLNLAADRHSLWMLDADVFSHTGVGGSSATQRMRDAGFDFSGSWRSAENIAVQSERGSSGIMDDVEDLHDSLMNSPGHRANILNPDLDYIGIGIHLGDFDFNSGTYESVIVTQNFASTGGDVDLDLGEQPQQTVSQAPVALAQTPAEPMDEAPQTPVTPVSDEEEAPEPSVTTPQDPNEEPSSPASAETQDTVTEWAAAFGAETIALIEGFVEDLAIDLPGVDMGPSQSLGQVVQDMVQSQFDQLEETFASLQTDDLAF
ncbi:MAG: CAP domain-containing protein [Pseudomonadota bacterium]